MIIAHFDQGWKHVKASELQYNIVKSYLKEYFEDESRTVLINNTWLNTEFCPQTEKYLGEGNSFKNKITEYINKHKHNIDNIVVYCLVDPPYEDPLKGLDVSGINVRYIGYYNSEDFIDFWAIMLMSHIKNKHVKSNNIHVPFMCLNGKPHSHREELVKNLIDRDLVKNNYVSFGGNERIPKITLDKIDKNQNLSIDPYDAMSFGDINIWNSHFLNIVTETVFDINKHFFWSEKIFKPIIGKRPFLVYSKESKLFYAKECILGYHNDFKDISDLDLTKYENLPDFLEELNKQDEKYFQQKYNSLKSKIDYNYDVFEKYYKSMIKKVNRSFKFSRLEELASLIGYSPIKIRTSPKINKLNKNNKALVFDCEFHRYRNYTNFDMSNKNKIFLIGSKSLSQSQENIIFYPEHYEFTVKNNKRKEINIAKNKNYLYDALLGGAKPNRIDLFERLINNKLSDKGLISLFKTLNDSGIHYESSCLREYEIPEINKLKKSMSNWQSIIPVHNNEVNAKCANSLIIPRKIYENCWISIISETFPNLDPDVPDDVFFPTEKTGKAFAAGRIFLVSANQGFLKELRNLGFKTFSEHIDESYDELETYQERNEAIVKELKRLQEEVDMYELHQKLLPVLQHNQDLIYSGKLQTRARLEVVKYIKRYS